MHHEGREVTRPGHCWPARRSPAPHLKQGGNRMKCPHCGEEIDMSLFGPGEVTRTAADIEADQRRARLDDANASTRPNTVTMDELKKGGGRK